MNEPMISILKNSNISNDDKKRLLRETAEMLRELFGDGCACNYNGMDEWLPEYCKYADTSCPNPGGAKCWEQYILHREKNK